MYKPSTSLLISGAACLLLISSYSEAGDWPDGCGNNKSHHANYGAKTYYDKILYVNQTAVTRNFLRKRSFDVEIPPNGTSRRGTISFIEVLDQYTDGNGGCSYLKSGGPGHDFVILHLKSQRNEGLNFIINVYGTLEGAPKY